MSENVNDLSVAELQQILRNRQARVGQLQKRREKLLSDIEEVERQIAEVSGSGSSSGGSVRRKNEKPLLEVICEVLAKNKKGLALSELTEAVLKTGYQSDSNNFKNIVYQSVYKSDLIAKDEKNKRYTLV